MSLNLGNEAIAAARMLHLSSEQAAFQAVRDAILEQARKSMTTALECEHTSRSDAIGYARAFRDLYVALEAAATDVNQRLVEKPGSEARRAAR